MPLDPVAYKPYADPDDFIREVTDHIWVERDIGFIEDNYEEDSIVHGSLGTTIGRADVIESTTMRIARSPSRVGQAEDVVWEARGEDAFLSSHLVIATDREILDGMVIPHRARTIANCLYRRGRMVEEWLVRDGLAIARANGEHPDEAARKLRFRGYSGSMLQPAKPDVLTEGDSGPRPDDFRPECEMVLELIEEVWNRRKLHRVHHFMVRDVFLHSVGDQTVVRPDGYQRETLRLLAPFPAGTFEVRDVQANHDQRYAGLRIAVMWKLNGTYDGVPDFGAPTGKPIQLLGVSQFLIQQGRIVREMRLYDELSLRAQINSTREDDQFETTNIY